MSRPRLHSTLELVFENKESVSSVLKHEDYNQFINKYSLNLSPSDLSIAFTHKSFSHEYQVPHQEQLEFLGDAVLQLIITEELFRRFPDYKEGHLSKLRSALVNEKSLSTLARGIELGSLLIVGKGEYKKKLFEQDVVLADTFEALLGQIYRFNGAQFTSQLFLNWLTTFIPDAFNDHFLDQFDAKSKLQERVLAKYKELPKYTASPVGDEFEITIWINNVPTARGIFSSKKIGEKELAQDVLKKGII